MDCGDEAATWIQTFLNKPGHRIVFAGPSLQKRKMRNHRKLEVRQANSEGEVDILDLIYVYEVCNLWDHQLVDLLVEVQ